LVLVANIGPGILVMLADTDAGNVVTAAQSGARWGYRLLPLLLGLIPVLYMVQELAVRLGIFTGRGYSELVRHRFGSGWAWVSAALLAVAVAGSMITEFAAVAGIGELYGVSRNLTLPLAASDLLIIVLSGSYRRVERTAILIGSFELTFLMVAAMTRPHFGDGSAGPNRHTRWQRRFLVSRGSPDRRGVQPFGWSITSSPPWPKSGWTTGITLRRGGIPHWGPCLPRW
jgi:NRAMP (natural resistance-associated macrophage protein)-like metal ion transporter